MVQIWAETARQRLQLRSIEADGFIRFFLFPCFMYLSRDLDSQRRRTKHPRHVLTRHLCFLYSLHKIPRMAALLGVGRRRPGLKLVRDLVEPQMGSV